jgi:hypothetical protein
LPYNVNVMPLLLPSSPFPSFSVASEIRSSVELGCGLPVIPWYTELMQWGTPGKNHPPTSPTVIYWPVVVLSETIASSHDRRNVRNFFWSYPNYFLFQNLIA